MKEVKRAYPNIYIKYKIYKFLSKYSFGIWLLSLPVSFVLAAIIAKNGTDFGWLILFSIIANSIFVYFGIAYDMSGITYLNFLKQETMKAYKKREKKEMKWLI